MPLIIAALLGLSALLIVVYPLLGLDREQARTAAGADSLTDVAERERIAKLALRDVSFDHSLGNLDEEDFEALRDRYERRALAALKTRYQFEQELDALIDQQLAALRAGEPNAPQEGTRAATAMRPRPAPGANGHTKNTRAPQQPRRRRGV
jgi:hypothetical protein